MRTGGKLQGLQPQLLQGTDLSSIAVAEVKYISVDGCCQGLMCISFDRYRNEDWL